MSRKPVKINCDACGKDIDLTKIKFSSCFRYSEKPHNEMVFACENCSHIILYKGFIMSPQQLKT